jgi:hypothetical protein
MQKTKCSCFYYSIELQKKNTSKFDWLGQIMWSIPLVNVWKLNDDDDSMKETQMVQTLIPPPQKRT